MAGAVSARLIPADAFAHGIAMRVAVVDARRCWPHRPPFAQTNCLESSASSAPPDRRAPALSKKAGAKRICSFRPMKFTTTMRTTWCPRVGIVHMYYNGSTIEADKVSYNQKNKRLRAEGQIRLTEADGKITYGDIWT